MEQTAESSTAVQCNRSAQLVRDESNVDTGGEIP